MNFTKPKPRFLNFLLGAVSLPLRGCERSMETTSGKTYTTKKHRYNIVQFLVNDIRIKRTYNQSALAVRDNSCLPAG